MTIQGLIDYLSDIPEEYKNLNIAHVDIANDIKEKDLISTFDGGWGY